MAIYHLTVKTGSRSGGQSAAAKSQYISRIGPYERGPGGLDRDRVLAMASGHMPPWAREAEGLDADRRSAACVRYWEAADLYERANGRLYTEVEFALPVELTHEQRVFLVATFAAERATLPDGSKLPFTWAMHAGGGTNPHVHLMISERINDGVERAPAGWFKRAATKDKAPESGGARKTDALSKRDWVTETRSLWADAANFALESAGQSARIDHRSNAERGIDELPGQHVSWGPAREHRQRANGGRKNLNTEERALRAERAQIITVQAAGLAQTQTKLNHDRHNRLGLPRRDFDQLGDAVADRFLGASYPSHRNRAAARDDEPRSSTTAGGKTASRKAGLRDVPGGRLDVRREHHPAGVLHGHQAHGMDTRGAAGDHGLRRAGAGDRGDAGAAGRVGPAQPQPAKSSNLGLGAAAAKDQLLIASRAWAEIGRGVAEKCEAWLARIQAVKAAQAAARKAGASGTAATLAKTPTLAGFTATSLRALNRLSERDLVEQLEIASKGVGAAQEAWRAALESGDRLAISATRAQSAARRARVAELQGEIKARTEAAHERAGVAAEVVVPAPVPASAPAPAAPPTAPPKPATIADLSDENLAMQRLRAGAAAAKAGQEIELRSALAQALAKRDQTRVVLDAAGWLSRRGAQAANDQAVAAVNAAVDAAKRAGLRFGTRADNTARIAAARELQGRELRRVQNGQAEEARRARITTAEATAPSAPAKVPVPAVPVPVPPVRQAAPALSEVPDRELARQVLGAQRAVEGAAKQGPATQERQRLDALLDEQRRRRTAAWAEAERLRVAAPEDTAQDQPDAEQEYHRDRRLH